MLHWLLHVTGIDTQSSPYYDFWSGIGTQIALLVTGLGLVRHKNCVVPGCWRLGHPHPEMNHRPVCKRHAP